MDDLDFVRRCCQGDKRSWGQFIDKYSRLIYSYIYSVLSAKGILAQAAPAEDIFQEIFHSLINDNYHKLKTFRALNGCSLASWLRQVTINFTLSYLRKEKEEASLDQPISDELALGDILPDAAPESPEILISQEKIAQLNDCINQLNAKDRLFLRLHILKNVKLEQLKNIFHLSRGAIDMQKSRIIQRLKDCFRSKGFALDF